MKVRFVVLALFVFGCAAGNAQDGGKRAEVVSVRDIDFLEPSPRLAAFVVGQAMRGVRVSREEANARSSASESKPTAKRQSIWRVLAESGMYLLGGVTTEMVCTARDDLPQETTALTAESLATCFDFLGDLVSGSGTEAHFLKAADNCNKNLVLTDADDNFAVKVND
ncbi:MAG: hypothetical protein K2J50_03505 [Treponemataceae bacterium]|nr:hypothetical protein [Treponemataceae bacterium]